VDGELRWAVTDGPEGTHAVELPEDDAGARRLVAQCRGRFWCATQAGGCGERLVVRGGPPSFRHADVDAWCRFADRGRLAVRAYEHLRYRPALAAWLTAQGCRPRVRTLPGPDGAIDLHVVVDEVGLAVEVQLSPLSDAAWRSRDDRCRGLHRHVVWMYGPGAEAAAATEAAVRGTAFLLRRQSRGLVVGVRDVEEHTRWVRLTACTVGADGFRAPGADEALAVHAQRTADRREAARRAAVPHRQRLDEPLPFPA
jgi:hypothetical protein